MVLCLYGIILYSKRENISKRLLWGSAGINPVIIIVPGHAFVGCETWEGSADYEVLETTKIGYEMFEVAMTVGQEQAENAKISDAMRKLHFKDGVRRVGAATILNIRQLKQRMGDMPI